MRSFEERLGHGFSTPSLLESAVVHRSFTSEHPDIPHNEREEFLGDAVLQLAVTEYLFRNHPGLPEGQMAKIRAASVNGDVLAGVARRLGLGVLLKLGKGEENTGGRDKDSILADAMEAVIAAVYLDAGWSTARDVVLRHWETVVASRAEQPGRRDYKTRFQEVLASEGRRPHYDVVGRGPDHDRVFTAVALVDGREVGRGTGKSKKAAEQEAARQALAERTS